MTAKFVKALHGGTRVLGLIFAFILLGGAISSSFADDRIEAQSIVDKAKGTLNDLMSDSNFSWLHTYIKDADAVLIFPQVLKGGFFIGGTGGSGVLMIRNKANKTWSEPAFYTLGSVTFGLQIGGEAAEVVMLAMNRKAVDTLLTSSVKLGADGSIAVGPIGGGAKGAVTLPAVTADFVSFSKAKGLYAGLNLEGAVLAVRDSLNESYYGKAVGPRDILIRHSVRNQNAEALRAALEKFSTK
ncbi:MAG: lipid-binding SYLF domain-containing protein [Geobacteraceae bacterium]|nr:lipid-binding SYLF domain-containing protein [Geobacteraceae bacterium]